ncbi:hydroxylamine reductase [Pararhodospirillum photometricum]|uniref:Hydroxylamine reductase n=1 Tax=Pararhodospirillum photometricum DSM 122 TaxID=1150469 RepID=H6SM61_PARPM|nr:hydroxylamine reductase [Pararhodospirillum photometricum]CCG09076.1 Hydroxylamine reductase [Pararhodospirillum photometricum DSM 122]
MYCYQCEETALHSGCTVKGVCGKRESTAGLQDLLVFVVRGMAWYGEALTGLGLGDRTHDSFIRRALFSTITNVGWDDTRFVALIEEALERRNALRRRFLERTGASWAEPLPEAATWHAPALAFAAKAADVGVLATENPDIRSLRELLVLGVKGIAAYAEHAAHLGYEKAEIGLFIERAMAATLRDLPADTLVALVLEAGHVAIAAMALLDEANTTTYGAPEISQVALGVRTRPGILVSGHDLRDLEELLRQTEGTGLDVYTHGEMLPAHAYPALKKYPHLAGNYGGAWWQQTQDFEAFQGPILMTTNCLVPLRQDNTYLDRLYTTGVVSYEGAHHVADRPEGGAKDFSALIARARQCPPPTALEAGQLTIGFAHQQVLALAGAVVEAVQQGAIRRFVVMAGCDGRHRARTYYTEVAQTLPQDSVILTAGCAKYRYNKLDLGTINGIPRVLDAGQCNDSYSLALIALALKDAFGLEDINELPVSYDIAWYEQKAVAVLLALLALGVKGIRLGPSLPAFLSPAVAQVLVERFHLRPIGSVDEDVAAMMAGA